jgi:uncharacterized protein YjgD (DUF1641 family)
MNKNLKEILKVLGGTITGAATLHAYYKETRDISNVKALEKLLVNSEELKKELIQNQNSSTELLKDQIISANQLSNYYKNKLIELTGDTRIPAQIKSEIYKTIKSEYNPDFTQEASTSMASAVQDYYTKNADSDSKSTFISNYNINDWFKTITESFNNYNEWLDSITLIQKGAVYHIIVSITILSLFFSLLTVYYSDSLIKYFNIEEKYPRLAKYISLRRKFQQFYFFTNSLVIIIFLIITLIFNIWIFFFVNL